MLRDYDEENNCAHCNHKLLVVHVELKLERNTYKEHVENDQNELAKKKMAVTKNIIHIINTSLECKEKNKNVYFLEENKKFAFAKGQ
jgi:hypothetical protein